MQVHFETTSEDNDEDFGHAVVKVQERARNVIVIHVGILKIHHKYEVKCVVPRIKDDEETRPDEDDVNVNCRLTALDSESGEVVVEVVAHKEKLQKETIKLKCGDGDSVNLVYQARVLGKGKGTPMLKEGVRLLEALPDPDESDYASDWKGFQ